MLTGINIISDDISKPLVVTLVVEVLDDASNRFLKLARHFIRYQTVPLVERLFRKGTLLPGICFNYCFTVLNSRTNKDASIILWFNGG